MFDYIWAELGLPSCNCPTCNYKIKFHGGWFPETVICGNCGQRIDIKRTLKKMKFPNLNYDKDGNLLREENDI